MRKSKKDDPILTADAEPCTDETFQLTLDSKSKMMVKIDPHLNL